MNSSNKDVYACPSFSSYTSNRLADIAEIVAVGRSNAAAGGIGEGGDGDLDDDFEFALVREDKEFSLDEFLCDGQSQIRQVFPVFDRDLLLDDGAEIGACGGGKLLESTIAIPLSKLFLEEDQMRDYPPSCSSSEAEELENIPEGTYCVWRPKIVEAPMPSQCKKSKSTGSASRRWKFRDLLRRSRSDGKDIFVISSPKHKEEKPVISVESPKNANGKGLRSASGGRTPGSPSPHEAFYVRNKAMKEGDKKKSYLPYRQELVGIFANVNGLSGSSFPHS